jgi:hypothetical protein
MASTCGQLFPSLSSRVSGSAGVGRVAPHAALAGYRDGGLAVFQVMPAPAPAQGAAAAAPAERLQSVPVTLAGGAPPLAGIQCLAACPLQAESPEHYLGLFAAAHRHSRAVTLGRVLVDHSARSGSLEACVEVLVSVPVEGAPQQGATATALHVDKHQLVYGTAEGVVTLRHLHESKSTKFYLAQGKRGRSGPGSGPQCHAVSTCWYANDIVVAAGCVAGESAQGATAALGIFFLTHVCSNHAPPPPSFPPSLPIAGAPRCTFLTAEPRQQRAAARSFPALPLPLAPPFCALRCTLTSTGQCTQAQTVGTCWLGTRAAQTSLQRWCAARTAGGPCTHWQLQSGAARGATAC